MGTVCGVGPTGLVVSALLVGGGGEFGWELLASVDVELLEDVPDVCFDRALGDEQTFGDLPIGPSLGGEAGDAELAGGQGLDAGEDRLAWTTAGGEEFLAGTRRERDGARAMGYLETVSEMVAGLDAVTIATKRSTELDESPSELETGGRLCK